VLVLVVAGLAGLAVWAVWRQSVLQRARATARRRLEAYVTGSRVHLRPGRETAARWRPYAALREAARARLEASGIRLSVREYLQMVLAAFLSGAFFGLVVRGWGGALLVGSAFAYGVWLWPERLAARRRQRFLEALPGAVDSMAAAMRAGQSLHQALAVLAREYGEPLGPEFKAVHDAVSLGASLPEEIRKMGRRVGVEEIRYLEAAIALHQRSGADLAQILERISESLRTRMELQAEIRAMTAQVRMSGRVLMWLPFVLAAGMWFIDRDYGATMLGTAPGRAVLAVSAVLLVIGRRLMRRLSEAV